MRDPQHGRQHSPDHLNNSKVLEILKKGIQVNSHTEIVSLGNKSDLLVRKVVSDDPNALSADGWSALSKAFSLSCINGPKQLIEIAKTFVAKGRNQPLSSQSMHGIDTVMSEITGNHSDLTFRDLATLCSFIVSLGRHDFMNGHQAIQAVGKLLTSVGTAQLTKQSVLGMAMAYLNLPQGTPLVHAEAFRRRLRTALQTGDEASPASAALFYLETSELPEEQRAVFRQAWDRIACQFDNPAGVFQQVASSIQELKKINAHFRALSSTLNTPETVARAITGQFKNLQQVSSIFVPHQEHLRLSGSDSDVALAKLEQGVDPSQLRNLIEFSRQSQIPLKDVPYIMSMVPSDAQQLLWGAQAAPTPDFAQVPTQTIRPSPEAMDAIELISPLITAGETDTRVLRGFMELSRRAELAQHLLDTELTTRFARRCTKKEPSRVDVKDVNELRIASALRHELIEAGHSVEQSRQIAWVYAADNHYRVPEFDGLIRALSEPSPRESFTAAMRKIADNRGIKDSQFRRALAFAAKALPEDWGLIRALYHSWTWRGAFSVSSLREAIRSSLEVRPNELHMELFRSVESRQIHQVREYLLAFVQSSDSEEDSYKKQQALNTLNSIYHLDLGPYPVYQGSGSAIHPDYLQMMTEVREVYRACFDMHYGFGHSTFECMTPPGAADWMLIRFGFDLAVRVDRLHSTNKDEYPGPGCLLSGWKLDRIFAKNPSTPHDAYSSFKDAWPWAANEFEDLAQTRLLVARGVKALIAPQHDKYHLDGTHYSVMAWPDHFLNPNLDAVALVPTEVLMTALRGKHSPIDEPGQRPTITPKNSVHDDALSFPRIVAESSARGLNVLNLGWVSNLGGLCNSYLPLSTPHFEWERKLLGHSQDRAGHVHKSHITGSYVSKINESTERLLAPLRTAHKSVYRVATAYFNLYDLHRISLAMWHKGLTVVEGMGEMTEPQFTQESGQQLNPHELRMLHEAYLWHGLHERGVTDKDAFPILCIAPTLDNWSKVRSPLILDTFDLSLRAAGHEAVQLPDGTGGHGTFEAGVWATVVKPLYFTDYNLDLRFLHRRSITDDITT